MSRKTRRPRLLPSMIAALFIFSAGQAIAGEETGVIEGTVQIAGEELIAGVEVMVFSKSQGVERKVTADEKGSFRVSDLPPAEDYRILATTKDYIGLNREFLTVTNEGVSTISLLLKPRGGQRTPLNKKILDSGSSSISEELISEFLDELANGRSFLDAVSMVAGVAGLEEPFSRADDNIGHGNSEYTFFHVHGADSTDNVFMLDGLETTDVATGRSGLAIPWEAIESVEVLTGGMTAEYGRATGGVVNVVTRSGGNSFHGSVPVYFTDDGLKRSRDEDANYYDEEDFKEFEWGGSLGGPVVKDRLWFFATYNRFKRTIQQNLYYDVYSSRAETFDEGLANMTWQVNADNKLRAQYAGNNGVWDSRDSINQSLHPSAYGQQESGGTLCQLQWTSIFSPDLFLEAQLGQHDNTWTEGPANAGFYDPRFVDQQDGMGTEIYGNVASITDVHRPRTQYKATLNYYKQWAGEHNFKFGAEYQDLEFETDRIYPDAYTINRGNSWDDRPDQWAETSDINYLDTGSNLTFFAQDSWTWHEDWTFNLGLRLEQQEQKNDVGEEVYSFDNLLSPRLGAAWDVSGDGRSRLFAHYGRYYHAVGLMLASALNRQDSESWRYEGDYESGDWEEVYYTPGYENPTEVDPDLKPNFKDEIILGYELQFATVFTAGARVIYNWQDNMIEDVLANEDEIRQGIDNSYLFTITNVESARRKYRGLELSLEKQLSNNYQFLAVCTLSEAKGSVVNDVYSEGRSLYADFEEMKYNRYGSLPWDDQQYLKVNGSYHLPLGFIIGTSLNYRSGRPYNRVSYPPYEAANFGYPDAYYVDPRGSESMGSAWWIDLRLRKDFEIGPTVLSLTADAFNLTNNQDVIRRYETDSSYHGEPNGWMPPGYFVLGGKFSF